MAKWKVSVDIVDTLKDKKTHAAFTSKDDLAVVMGEVEESLSPSEQITKVEVERC